VFDLDSIIFTVAWKYRNNKTKKIVKMSAAQFIRDVLTSTRADDYVGFYASKKEGAAPNFRYAIDSKYKANRPPTPDFVKKWRDAITEVFDEFGFIGIDGMEADDAVAIAVEYYRDHYNKIVVASFDKDLKQIPDITYYYMKEHTQEEIDANQATYNLCMQMLTGDRTDNIKGLDKIGPVKAKKLLEPAVTRLQMWGCVINAYKEHAKKQYDFELSALKKEIEEEVQEAIDNGNAKFMKMTDKQRERHIRVTAKKRHGKKFDWKSYFNMQKALLTMLTEPPEEFEVPEPKENPMLEEIKKKEELAAHLDDFLTV
jgi:5'-3' exonuclease